MMRASTDPDELLSLADRLVCHPGEDRQQVEEGLKLCQRGRTLAEHRGDARLEFELRLLEGTALNQLGESTRALESLDAALALRPEAIDAQLERAISLFELCRFEDAREALEQVIAHAPDEPWAHHHLGLLAERSGDRRRAEKHFVRARALSPEDFPRPLKLDEDAFDRAVEEAIASLPEPVRPYLDHTTIAVAPLPSDEALRASQPPLSPAILGVFSGSPLREQDVLNPLDHVPPQIVLFQRNLERFAQTHEELVEQIGITLLHEVGHLIGLDEHELWERGLE